MTTLPQNRTSLLPVDATDQARAEKIAAVAASLAFEGEDWAIVEGALALLASRGEWKLVERGHRRALRIVTNDDASSVRARHLWRDLGRVYRDRLDAHDSAVEAFAMWVRVAGDDVVEAKLELADLHQRMKDYDKALELLDGMLATRHSNKTYEHLFEIHSLRGDTEAAWRAAAALVVLGEPRDPIRDFYEDHAPRVLPMRARALGRDEWEKLRDPEETPHVAAILAQMAPVTTSSGDRVGLVEEAVAWACDATTNLRAGTKLDELRHSHSLRERLFHAGRAAMTRHHPEYALADLPMSTLKAALYAALVTFRSAVEVPAEIAQETALLRARIDADLSADARTALQRAVIAFFAESGRADLARWRIGVHKTFLRAGVLLAGDPCALGATLTKPNGWFDEVVTLSVVAPFMASKLHGELRAVLGWTRAAPSAAEVESPEPEPRPPPPSILPLPLPGPIEPFAPSAPARTTTEMAFVASLQKCPACGERAAGPFDFVPDGDRWRATAQCLRCTGERTFVFAVAIGDPTTAHHLGFSLGEGSSALLSTAELLEAFELANGDLPWQLERAFTCVVELLKMIPRDADRIPDTTDARLTRASIHEEYKRLYRMAEAQRPPATLSADTLSAHEAWLDRGAKGAGRLVLEGTSLRNQKYEDLVATLARIADSDFTLVGLEKPQFQLAELHRVTFSHAKMRDARFAEASIRDGTWRFAELSCAFFGEAVIKGTDFSGAYLERADFSRARVTGATFDGAKFGSAVFDDAVFERCSFRWASMAEFVSPPLPTSVRARFVECDFTGVDWSKRDLSRTTFVRCKLAEARGIARAAEGLVLDDCDVALSAFSAVPGRETKTCGACKASVAPKMDGAGEGVGEECPACGHLAPDLAGAYPRLEIAMSVRPELLAVPGRSKLALRCLAIANLFTDVDLEQEEHWSRRAVAFDAAAGNVAGAQAAQRRADSCARPARAPTPAAERVARTAAEMRFAASLVPCSGCAKTFAGRLDLVGVKTKWTLVGTCTHCRAPRTMSFVTEGDPNTAPCPPGQLGDERPSRILEPGALFAELLRLEPLANDDDAAKERAFLCIRELRKFPAEALAAVKTSKGAPLRAFDLDLTYQKLHAWAVGAHGASLDSITRVLFDEAGPPPTVGALEQALGLRMTDAHVATNAHGHVKFAATPLLSLGPDMRTVHMEYFLRRKITTLAELRARPLTRWSIDFCRGYEAILPNVATRPEWALTSVAPGGICTLSWTEPTRASS